MSIPCPLCKSTYRSELLNQHLQCHDCGLIQRLPQFQLDQSSERESYLKHQMRDDDEGYLKFVNPILSYVPQNFNFEMEGLDFGCGHVPVLGNALIQKGFMLSLFDPYFFPNAEKLQRRYDYVICCEVVEHFAQPAKEFRLLRKLLKDRGKLLIMTHLYDQSMDFGTWYYKNDATHVSIFQAKTLQYVVENFGFNKVEITGRFIVLE